MFESTPPSKLERLLSAIDGIERTLQEHRNHFVTAYSKEVSGTELRNCMIFSNLEELATIFRTTHKSIQTFSVALYKYPKDVQDFDALMLTQNEIKVNIQVIYEWLYHLKELLEHYKDLLTGNDLWLRMQLHCKFRNHIITHPSISLFPRKGMPFSERYDDVWLEAHTYFPTDQAFQELECLLFGLLGAHVSRQPNEVTGFAVGCSQLFDTIHERPSELVKQLGPFMGKLDAFILKWGAVSASPLTLAEHVRSLTNVLLPRLRD